MTHLQDIKTVTRTAPISQVTVAEVGQKSQLGHSLTLKRSADNTPKSHNSAGAESQRVIIVSHSYAPMLNPRAFRWTALAERWVSEGKQVDVVCSWGAGLQATEHKEGVRIHRVGAGMIERLRTLLRSKDRNAQPIQTPENQTPGESLLKTLARKAHDLTWKNIYWPDYAALWSKSAIQQAHTLLKGATENITLITVSDPFTSHVVGRALKRQHPALNWIVDIGDPFCFRHDTPTNNHLLYRSLNYRYERTIFAEADSVSVTTEATKRKYAELFPESAHKILVIPPLVSFPAAHAMSHPLGEDTAYKALFTGALYRSIRNPEYVLRLFNALQAEDNTCKRELHFFGPAGDCQDIFEPFLSPHSQDNGLSVHLHGLKSREETLAALQQADLLINIGNANPYQLPSKVVEYACTNKPILNISCIANDSSAEFFAARPNTLTLSAVDGQTLTEHVATLKRFIQTEADAVSQEYIAEIQNTHSIAAIGAAYQELMRVTQKESYG